MDKRLRRTPNNDIRLPQSHAHTYVHTYKGFQGEKKNKIKVENEDASF